MALIRQIVQSSNHAVLPIFRSATLARLLAFLFLRADPQPVALSSIARELGVAPSTVKREIDTLEAAGLVRSERVGRTRVVVADETSPFFSDLRALVLKAFGPAIVLKRVLAGIAGIEAAYVFGSWAARQLGVPGPPPRDIDVVVVGRPELDEVYAAAAEAERDLGREVNVTVASKHDWDFPPTQFLSTILTGPKIEIETT